MLGMDGLQLVSTKVGDGSGDGLLYVQLILPFCGLLIILMEEYMSRMWIW